MRRDGTSGRTPDGGGTPAGRGGTPAPGRPAAPVRRVLVLVSGIVLLDVLFYSAIAPLLPTYVDELGLSKSQAGVLTGAYAFGTLVCALPSGWVAARWGTRRTLLLGLGLLAVASLAFGLGRVFVVLTAARFVQGAGGAAAWAAGLAWLVEVTPRERRGAVIGTALGTGIAGAVGGPVLGAVAQALGPQFVFPAVGVVALGLAAGVVALGASARPQTSGDLRAALRDRRVWAGSWLTTLPALFFGTYGVLVPLHLDALGVAAAGVAGVFLVAAAVEAVVSPLVGRLSDRRGPLVPVRAGLVGITATAVLLAVPRGAVLVGAVVVAAAATGGMLFAPASSLLSHGAEDAGLPQGIVFGLFNFAWAGGQVAGAAGGARLADVTVDLVPYTTVAVLALGTLAVLSRRRPRAAAASRPAG